MKSTLFKAFSKLSKSVKMLAHEPEVRFSSFSSWPNLEWQFQIIFHFIYPTIISSKHPDFHTIQKHFRGSLIRLLTKSRLFTERGVS